MNKYYLILVVALFLQSLLSASFAEQEPYEVPQILQAKDVVPEDLLKSDLYSIEDEVATRGYTNTYQINSKFGMFTAHGNEMLVQRIQEIRAIQELENIKKSEEFAEGLKAGAKAPFSFVKNLVTHPVDTVSGIPKGLWRYGSRVGEMATGDKSEYEDSIGKELILFSAQKRKLAYDLNVDVYSSNKILQEYLNSVSWASYSGGMVVTAALTPLGAIRFTKTAHNINNLIRDNSPEDLRKINRKVLEKLDVSDNVIEEFLDSNWLSPRHETEITHSLDSLGLKSGVSSFIELASTSSSEEDAFFFTNIAKLIEHYITNTAEVENSILVHNNFALLRVRKHFILPLLVDNGYWSEFGANHMNTFESELRSEYGRNVQILLWITGEVSDRAKKELAARNILLVENALDTIGKNL
jgi:hypothetical protein